MQFTVTKHSQSSSPPSAESLLKYYPVVYDALASDYDAERFTSRPGQYDFEETRYVVRGVVGELLAAREQWLALDVACGTGKIALFAAEEEGCRVVALDAALNMLRQCSKNAMQARLMPKVMPTNASANSLPYRDNSFDICFSFRFLHLLPADQYLAILREMVRVVKPGGHVVIEVTNSRYATALHLLRRCLASTKNGPTSRSCMNIRQLSRLVRNVEGVSLHSVRGFLFPKAWWLMGHSRFLGVARRLASGPLKSFSEYLVAVYQKN